jgi:ATP-binding cassette, subfamily B, bacterial MsbA
MLMLIAPIKHLSEVASPITRGLAAVERGLDLIDDIPPETGGTHDVAHARGELALENVSVRYPGSSTDALDGVSLHVKPGQTVALVGSSGSGKTTLVNLLPRFVEPTAGRILLDGVELREWNLNALRRQFSFVSQDVVMFNDSIAANVTLGLERDRARVEAALDAANLRAHVDSLPQGMDTVVGHNATQLSGGQRQRLAIARALYKNAPILVLDEATSALDTESEQAVKGALQRLMAGRTTLVIAHRLSTIEHADRILVMSAGRIVEEGSHDELLRRNGHYARLYNLAVTSDLDTTQESILQ